MEYDYHAVSRLLAHRHMTSILKTPMDAAAELTRLGGCYCHNRDGDFWKFTANEFTVHIEPFIRAKCEHRLLGIEWAIEHREFAAVVRQILGDSRDTFQAMRWEQKISEAQSPEQAPEAFRSLVSSALTFIRALSLSDMVGEFKATLPDRPSGRQLFHLAALAWDGDYSTLGDYQRIFAQGKRLNFVPMITRRMIDSALAIANKRFAASFDDKLSPNEPENA